jgi:hypothetical protein
VLPRDYWLVTIISGVVYVAMFIFLPETYRPKLLQDKALRLGLQIPHERLGSKLRTGLVRPTVMLFTEPILFLLSLYMAFVYGILYLDFTAYPYVFQKTRHWEQGIAGLAFLGESASAAYISLAC